MRRVTGAPWEHLQETGAPCPGPLIGRLRHWHDWNISAETRGTWPELDPTCLSRVDMCSVWLEHYGVSITPGHWPPRLAWNLRQQTGEWTYIRLAVWGLGKKEKYVLICCSICISTFAVNFGLGFDKWVSPANRELCVFCKIRLMGDWRIEIGSRLTQEQRTSTGFTHNYMSEVSSWYSNLFLLFLKLCVLQLRKD